MGTRRQTRGICYALVRLYYQTLYTLHADENSNNRCVFWTLPHDYLAGHLKTMESDLAGHLKTMILSDFQEIKEPSHTIFGVIFSQSAALSAARRT